MPESNTDQVIVGRIRRPRGTMGYVLVEAMSDQPDRFVAGQKVFIDGTVRVVQDVRELGEGLLIKFEGIESPEAAEELGGADITVDASRLQPLAEGTYYHYHLIGMQVYTTDRRHLGTISDVLATGGNDVYVVNDGDRELLIPAISQVVREVDTVRGEMVVDLPEGLEPGPRSS